MKFSQKLKLHLKNIAVGSGMGLGIVGAALLGGVTGVPMAILLTTGVAVVGCSCVVGSMIQKNTFCVSSMLPSFALASLGSMMLISHIGAATKMPTAEVLFTARKPLVLVFDQAASHSQKMFAAKLTKSSIAFRSNG